MSAKSISRATPTILAGTTVVRVESAARSGSSSIAGGSTTCTRCAPFTTCAFVMMYPLDSTTNPEPIARCLPITALALPFSPSSSGPYPVTNICTTLGETFLISAPADSFSFRSSSVRGSSLPCSLLPRSADCPFTPAHKTKRDSTHTMQMARSCKRRQLRDRCCTPKLAIDNISKLEGFLLRMQEKGCRSTTPKSGQASTWLTALNLAGILRPHASLSRRDLQAIWRVLGAGKRVSEYNAKVRAGEYLVDGAESGGDTTPSCKSL